jgi:hypothetical protein
LEGAIDQLTIDDAPLQVGFDTILTQTVGLADLL